MMYISDTNGRSGALPSYGVYMGNIYYHAVYTHACVQPTQRWLESVQIVILLSQCEERIEEKGSIPLPGQYDL